MHAILLFEDLDTSTWMMSIASLAISLFIIGTDIYNWRQKIPIGSRRARIALLGLAFFCAAGVYETISNASDAPRIPVSGMITTIREVYLGHSRYWYLAHVIGADGLSKELNFDSNALRVIKEHSRSTSYNVTYLDDPDEYYDHGKQHFWFKVVDITNAETGESYYHFDTRHHPVRVAFYLGDTVLLIVVSILVGRLSDASPDTEDDYENYRSADDNKSAGTELTSLDLNSSRDESI